MRNFRQVVTATAGGISYSQPYIVDTYCNPCNIGFACILVGTTSAAYTVQHTFTDPTTTDLNVVTNGTWLSHEFLSSGTSTDDGNYAYPVRAIRIYITAAASANVTFDLVQAGVQG